MEKEKLILDQHNLIVEQKEKLQETKDTIDSQAKTIDKQLQKIEDQKAVIKDLKQEMKNMTEKQLIEKLIVDTKQYEKKEHKFNFKAWLIASSFAIGSLLVGIVNLILRFVKI